MGRALDGAPSHPSHYTIHPVLHYHYISLTSGHEIAEIDCMIDTRITAAIAEITSPQLGTTEQLLAVHRLALTNNTFHPTHIETTDDPPQATIYFRITDAPYFFAIVVQPQANQPKAVASYIEAAVKVYLAISSDTLDPQTITQYIGIAPTKTRQKGEQVRPYLQRTYAENRWYYELQPEDAASPEDKIKRLLNYISPAANGFAQLGTACHVVLHIVYKGYQSSMGGLHLNTEMARQIAIIGAAIDIDLYAYGPELPD